MKTKDFIIIAFIWIFVGCGMGSYYFKSTEIIKKEYTDILRFKTKVVKNALEVFFSNAYEHARVISLLPSTRHLEATKYKLKFDDSILISQIYLSAFAKTQFSEIYIIPLITDPKKLTTAQLLSETYPIITFDSEIVNTVNHRSHQTTDPSILNHPEIPQEEAYEYSEMIKQFHYFQDNYSQFNLEQNINIPALVSEPVITCDNSEMTLDMFMKKNDTNRKGIVFSIPYYNLKNKLAGMVSVVILKNKLISLLQNNPHLQFGKVNKKSEIYYYTPHEKEHLYSSIPLHSKLHTSPTPSEIDHDSFYYEVFDLNLVDSEKWQLIANYDYNEYYESVEYNSFVQSFAISCIALLLVLLVGTFVFFKQKNQSKNLELLVQSKTDELLESQAALIHSSQLATIGEMSASIAHEISNPNAIIETLINRILKLNEDSKLSTDILNTQLNKILNASQRITKITTGLRNFARGGETDNFSEFLVLDLIRESVDLANNKLKYAGIDIEINVNDGLTFVGDRIQLSQVLINLITNAADAIAPLSEKWIKIEAQLAGDNLQELSILVIDSGPGIPLEIENKIFKSFFTTKGIGKGTGLGLSLSKKIIEKFNGKLAINRALPNTCFEIRLPIFKK